MHRRTLAAIGASIVLAVAVAGIWRTGVETSTRISESNKRWCPMVSLLLPAPGEAVPTTERGRQIVAQARTLSLAFGCS